MFQTDRRQAALCIAALGIVFGDIGTSPLYALRECFRGGTSLALSHANILGVLSVIFWALTLIISLFYVQLVLRADHHGEGGILALMALLTHDENGRRRVNAPVVLAVGLFGAALLYGDGVITPAISVLSAVEGLETFAPGTRSLVVPITLAILVALFAVQHRGTAAIGAVFGPVTLTWFAAIALWGLVSIVQTPAVLGALSPAHALHFLTHGGWTAFVTLGAVFLVITGAEVLYADMGHFGAAPIRRMWYLVVLPSLMLNYLGQGALLMRDPSAIANPFYALVPGWAVLPMVLLATAATVIASQSGISGVFSLTRQAMQLGYAPRMEVRHTSATEIGQVYVPAMNRVLLVSTLALVLLFQRSGALAAAYGLGVATTMMITIGLLGLAMRRIWRWSPVLTAAITGSFLALGGTFFAANALKLGDGGWIPLAGGFGVFLLMSTWQRGRSLLAARLLARTPRSEELAPLFGEAPVTRVPGTAVYLAGDPTRAPAALLHNVVAHKTMHEQVVLLTLVAEAVPYVPQTRRLAIAELWPGMHRVVVRLGYLQRADVAALVAELPAAGLAVNASDTTYFVGRETLVEAEESELPGWQRTLFALMSRNAQGATRFFGVPAAKVVEVGVQVAL